jgi:hypothetical protein
MEGNGDELSAASSQPSVFSIARRPLFLWRGFKGVRRLTNGAINATICGTSTTLIVLLDGYETARNCPSEGYETACNVTPDGYKTMRSVQSDGHKEERNVQSDGYETW